MSLFYSIFRMCISRAKQRADLTDGLLKNTMGASTADKESLSTITLTNSLRSQTLHLSSAQDYLHFRVSARNCVRRFLISCYRFHCVL